MPYLLGFHIKSKNVLAIGDGNLFIGSDDLTDALKLLPKYSQIHGTGYTQSMSACINWMYFSPRLFFFENFKGVELSLLDHKIWNGGNISAKILYTNFKDDYVPNVAHVAQLV